MRVKIISARNTVATVVSCYSSEFSEELRVICLHQKAMLPSCGQLMSDLPGSEGLPKATTCAANAMVDGDVKYTKMSLHRFAAAIPVNVRIPRVVTVGVYDV